MRFPFQLLETADFDVVGFGTNAVDHLIVVPEYPRFNSKIEFVEHSRDAGGEVATTLAGLERLGLRTAYAGHFGGDSEGALGLESLNAEGVNTDHCEIVDGASTQKAFIIIDRHSGERTILWNRDPKLAYTPDAAPLDLAGRGKVLHMTPHDIDACILMAERAKENCVVVSLDVDRAVEGLGGLMRFVDVLVGSSEFSEGVTGLSDQRAALRKIHDNYGCAVVGTTLGSAGSIILCDGDFITTPAFDVPGRCTDTTGAGDAFRSGFLYGMLAGETVEECARLANAVAALKCRILGARAGLPTKQELEVFAKNPRHKQCL
jgi:sulfofructose kinase